MKTRLFTLIALFSTVFTFNSFAQTPDSVEVRRTVGLSANVQNSEYGITVPIFISQRFVLAPALGVFYAEGIATDISVGLMPKYYFETGRFAPYSALRIGAIMNRPSSESSAQSTTDLLAGIAGGAEYFPIPNFSFGVEGQLNLTMADEKSGRFGNESGINANLATAVTANIYFTRK